VNIMIQGQPVTEVDPGKFTFVNHGCNGTSNSDYMDSNNITELTADPYNPPVNHSLDQKNRFYNPAMERMVVADQLNFKDIPQGGEVLGNYLTYLDPIDDWESGVLEIRADCAGLLGAVEMYQRGERIYADDDELAEGNDTDDHGKDEL
jgi:hypothetical protein